MIQRTTRRHASARPLHLRASLPRRATLLLYACLTAWRAGAEDIPVYSDALQDPWQNWSWASVDLAATARVHAGARAISVTATNWGALYLHTPAMSTAGYTGLTFWVNGGAAGGQSLQVQAVRGGNGQTAVELDPLPTNAWRQVAVSMAAMGAADVANFEGFWLQIRSASAVPPFYVDDVVLAAGPPPPVVTSSVTIAVDAAADRHPISPQIYGVCFGASNQLVELRAPLNRSGGNATTRYNWEANASNHAFDWYFESLAEEGVEPGAMVDDFVAGTRFAAADAMVTIPINGWVAKLGPGRARLCSYSIAKYGAQTGNDAAWFPDAGNGILTATGKRITNNAPTDANQTADPAFQAGWVRHLTNRWGAAASGGVRYYLMDNEWGLWHSSHVDVWPVGATMEQGRDLFCDYAAMVKDIDPAAKVAGPEEWGWTGYLYSGYDAQWGSLHGWSGLPDRAAHGGADFMPWWLAQIRQRSEAAGRRLLDVFTLHVYPQGGEFSDDVSASMQLRRNRSTRALWDTNYVDETWIADRVMLIPRMKQWVATNYPGTAIGLTEYSWGADTHMNGGTAQADVLGILGREGVDLATRWVCPPTGSPAYRAYKIYRNPDGTNAGFGDVSVRAVAPDPDTVAVFAAQRTGDGALTVVAVNKQSTTAASLDLRITNAVHAGTVRMWRLAGTNDVMRVPDAAIMSNRVAVVLPAQSVTLMVAMPPPTLAAPARAPDGTFSFRVQGEAGRAYVTERSADLRSWSPLATNTLGADTGTLAVPAGAGSSFFRTAVRPP